jgi:hypothetical protein|nr:MAG TPA: outer capsid protein sigma-1 attachment protein [Bacteriophage sp.]
METARRMSPNQIDKKKQLRKRLLIGAGVLGAGLGGYGLYKLGHINGQIKANKNLEDAFDKVRESSKNLEKYSDLASKISTDSSIYGGDAKRAADSLITISRGFSENSLDKKKDNDKIKRRNRIIRNSLIGIGALGGAAALGYGIYNRNKKLKGLKSGIDSFRNSAYDTQVSVDSIGRDLDRTDSNLSSLGKDITRMYRPTIDIEDKLEDNSRDLKKGWSKINELKARIEDHKAREASLGHEVSQYRNRYNNLWGIFKSGRKYDEGHDYWPEINE